jgi:hypothetical protein
MARSRCRVRSSRKNIEDSQNYSGVELPLSEHPKLRGRKLKHVESLCGESCGPLIGVRRAEGLELRHEGHVGCWCIPEVIIEGDWALVVHRPPSDADA